MAITALPDDAALDATPAGAGQSTGPKITELPADAKITPLGHDVPDWQRPFVGANRSLADMAGAPVDIATSVLNRVAQPVQDFAREVGRYRAGLPPATEPVEPFYDPAKSIGGSASIKRAFGLVGANPDEVAPATTATQRVLEAAGSGAASMALPGMGAEAMLARTSADSALFGKTALDIIRGSGTASNLVLGAASGAGGEAAAEAVPDAYKPVARLGGGMAAGLGVAGVIAAGKATVGAIGEAWRAMTEPAQLRAAREILAHASNTAAFRDELGAAAQEPPLVEGSEPTTAQVGDDLGVLAHERTLAASSPSNVAAFAARRTVQNAARVAALDQLADPAADPAAVTDYVKARLQEITDDHAAKVGAAAHGVADALTAAGGDSFDNPAAYGEALRAPLAGLHQQAKDATSALWRAIDPDMSAPVNASGLKQSTAELAKSIPEIARQPEGEEASIIKGIGAMPDTADFGSMVALRGRLTDAMRTERQGGSPTVLRRLAITLDSVDDTLAGAAGDIAADPARRGALVENLREEASLWQKSRPVLAGRAQDIDEAAGDNFGLEIAPRSGDAPSDRGVATVGTSAVPAASGGQGEAGGQPGLPKGNPGVQGLPDEVAERYAAARAATKETKGTFESGPVGGVLAPGAQFGSFKTTASNVGKNLFDRPEALQAYVDAAKGDPAALAPMQDYAAFSLRQAAVKDGMLSPAKYRQWIADHGYALRQFPELGAKFADVETAQSTLDASLAAQKQALVDYQTGAVGKLLGGQDPVQAAGRALSNPAQFADLVAKTSGSPAATAGLKRAIVDYMMGKSLSTAEAGTSGVQQINAATLQKFYLQNRTALSGLFSDDELASMGAVTADLQRANRSIVAVKIPGGSNTAQDTGGRAMSMLQNLAKQYGGKALGAVAGSAVGGPVGTGVGLLAGAAGDFLRTTRMGSIDKAVTEMMLDPKMAAAWIAKVPANVGAKVSTINAPQDIPAASSFIRQLRAVTAGQVTQAINQENGKSP